MNSMADAFGHAATQAPHPIQDAARNAVSAACFETGTAFASGAAPVGTLIQAPASMILSNAADAPPVRRRKLRITDLRDRPLVMFRDGYDLRQVTLEALRRAGVQPTFSVEGGEMDAVLAFVEAGLGVAVVPSMVLEGRPRLRSTPFAAPGLSRTVALAHRRDVDPPRAAREFRSMLIDGLRQSAVSGTLPAGLKLVGGLRTRS